MKQQIYKAVISSDWNQCLAPCGPFDVISYTYPELTPEVESIFQQYTSNLMPLRAAVEKITTILPEQISIRQMDAYLDNSFQTYKGVPELVDWCLQNGLLFMINTTGLMGYFQRVFAKKLFPKVTVVSANPLIRYPFSADDPLMYELVETEDKGKNTESVLKRYNISPEHTILLGDSGGDGPHFDWGERHAVKKIGCMAKQSLITYCARRQITIDMFFGPSPAPNEQRNARKEMCVDFLELRSIFSTLSV